MWEWQLEQKETCRRWWEQQWNRQETELGLAEIKMLSFSSVPGWKGWMDLGWIGPRLFKISNNERLSDCWWEIPSASSSVFCGGGYEGSEVKCKEEISLTGWLCEEVMSQTVVDAGCLFSEGKVFLGKLTLYISYGLEIHRTHFLWTKS